MKTKIQFIDKKHEEEKEKINSRTHNEKGRKRIEGR